MGGREAREGVRLPGLSALASALGCSRVAAVLGPHVLAVGIAPRVETAAVGDGVCLAFALLA
jgi:hypothetical protein